MSEGIPSPFSTGLDTEMSALLTECLSELSCEPPPEVGLTHSEDVIDLACDIDESCNVRQIDVLSTDTNIEHTATGTDQKKESIQGDVLGALLEDFNEYFHQMHIGYASKDDSTQVEDVDARSVFMRNAQATLFKKMSNRSLFAAASVSNSPMDMKEDENNKDTVFATSSRETLPEMHILAITDEVPCGIIQNVVPAGVSTDDNDENTRTKGECESKHRRAGVINPPISLSTLDTSDFDKRNSISFGLRQMKRFEDKPQSSNSEELSDDNSKELRNRTLFRRDIPPKQDSYREPSQSPLKRRLDRQSDEPNAKCRRRSRSFIDSETGESFVDAWQRVRFHSTGIERYNVGAGMKNSHAVTKTSRIYRTFRIPKRKSDTASTSTVESPKRSKQTHEFESEGMLQKTASGSTATSTTESPKRSKPTHEFESDAMLKAENNSTAMRTTKSPRRSKQTQEFESETMFEANYTSTATSTTDSPKRSKPTHEFESDTMLKAENSSTAMRTTKSPRRSKQIHEFESKTVFEANYTSTATSTTKSPKRSKSTHEFESETMLKAESSSSATTPAERSKSLSKSMSLNLKQC